MYVENIVIGKPVVEPQHLFALDEDDWNRVEKEKTYYTEERFLPRILVDIGIYPSISEIRRNKPQLKEKLDSKKLKLKKQDSYGRYTNNYEEVSFETYISRQFDPSEEIKKELDTFMDDIRKQVNTTMKETFDNSTKSMLSNAVLSILSANDTYRQIENNIKCIADKQA